MSSNNGKLHDKKLMVYKALLYIYEILVCKRKGGRNDIFKRVER